MAGLRERANPDIDNPLNGRQPLIVTKGPSSAAEQAHFIRNRIPRGGLFAGHDWRISPEPFLIDSRTLRDIEFLGRVLLKFYRTIELLYRQSVEGKQPKWIADYLDRGKPAGAIALQRSEGFRHEIPRVIRPDVLLTEEGLSIIELDSVPGGIGLTAWLNQTYSALPQSAPVIGGADGMQRGFAGIFGDAPRVHIVVSEEAGTYLPEMEWLARELGQKRFQVRGPKFSEFADGDAVYRFFEMFDLANVPGSRAGFELAGQNRIRLTPPPKPIFEEKMIFALLWNLNLREYWRQQLGQAFLERMLQAVPYTWIVDPAPLPPHAAYPEIGLTNWQQLKTLSQRQRDLILKVSGYSDEAWGARGVYLGSDLAYAEWAAAVDKAIQSFDTNPYVLQRFQKPALHEARYYDFERGRVELMQGRVRLCPYYFVGGERESARAELGGVLATICPADKKIIHGMKEAILAPCAVASGAA